MLTPGVIYINIDPIAFSIGSVTVGWYGIMVALAVVSLVVWALVAVKRGAAGLTYDTVINAAIVGIPSGIIFSRLLHVIDLWDYYVHNPGKIIGGEGLTIWGAVLGAALGIWIYSRIKKISFGHLADVIAPGIILAQAIGRVGCTILGDDYGFPTTLPWGYVYTSPNSPAFSAVGLTPTHPVVTYEIIFNLIVFGILLILRKKLKPDGSLFLVYLSFYSVWRIGSDFLREGTDFLFGLHQAQFIGVVVLVICLVLLIWKTRWVKNEGAEVSNDVRPSSGESTSA
jgi:phosphatidylglycerol:prolipoprotein diacylglycerol transferase